MNFNESQGRFSLPRRTLTLHAKLITVLAIPVLAILSIAVGLYLVTNLVKEKVHLAENESSVFALLAKDLKLNAVQVQQFLTDVSATRGQDGLDSGFGEAEENAREFRTGLARFQAMFERNKDTAGLAEVARLNEDFDVYYATGKSMARAYVANGPSEGNKLMAVFDQSAEQLMEPLEKFVRLKTENLNVALAGIETTTSTLRNVTIGAAVSVLILCSFVLMLVSRTFFRPFQVIVNGLTSSVEQTANAATQVALAGKSLADGASQQAASIEETSASLEEVSNMTRRNAENAAEARALSSQTRTAADTGANDMESMKLAMDEIKVSSSEISKIIKAIDEIAFQTNILALNAAVEAARAGSAGLGFAVVADEVRGLAQRSAQSAKETASKIEVAVDKSEQGVRICGKVAVSLAEIVNKARKVDGLVAEIAEASKEQSHGIAQVNAAVSETEKITQANAASAEESAAAAGELSAQAILQKETVAKLLGLVGASHDRENGDRRTVEYSRGGFTRPVMTRISIPRPALRVGSRDSNGLIEEL